MDLLMPPCTHHRLQPGAECGWEAGQQLHAFFCLGVEKGMSQPLPCQHEQLRCQHFFVMNLQNGLRMNMEKQHSQSYSNCSLKAASEESLLLLST